MHAGGSFAPVYCEHLPLCCAVAGKGGWLAVNLRHWCARAAYCACTRVLIMLIQESVTVTYGHVMIIWGSVMITESSSCPLLMFAVSAAVKALLAAMTGCWGSAGLGILEIVGMLLPELLTGNGALAAEQCALSSHLLQITVHGMLFSSDIVTWL
jgi:hypothetical protein